MTHTPTPWTTEDSRTIKTESGEFFLSYLNDKHGNSKWLQSYAELDANAQFIIKACNAHEELVGVLKGVLSHNRVLKQQYQFPDSLIRQIETAIAKAEKG